MKQKQIDDQKPDTLYSKQSIRSPMTIVVYIQGKQSHSQGLTLQHDIVLSLYTKLPRC